MPFIPDKPLSGFMPDKPTPGFVSDMGGAAPGTTPETALNEQGVTAGERFQVQNWEPNQASAMDWLHGKGYDVGVKEGRIAIKKPDQPWKLVHPKGLDLQDVSDEVASAINFVLSGAGMVIGGIAGAPGGPVGVLAGGAAGGAAGSGIAETIRQGIGEQQGFKSTPGEKLGSIALETGLGAAAPVVGAGVAKGIKAAVPVIKATVPKAAGAVWGGAKAAVTEAPIVGPYMKAIGRGIKEGWEGKALRPSPAVKEIIEKKIAPELLPVPAAQEIAKRAAAGELISPMEDSILGRSIAASQGMTLEPAEVAAQQLIWESANQGSRLNVRGEPIGIKWFGRTTSARGGQGELKEGTFLARPSFASRAETKSILDRAKLNDDEMRALLQKQNVKGAVVKKSIHDQGEYFAPVLTADNPKSAVVPLSALTRPTLEDLFYQMQPDVMLWMKGGAYNPNLYKHIRLIDYEKSTPLWMPKQIPADLMGYYSEGKIPPELMGNIKGLFPEKSMKIKERIAWKSIGLNDIQELKIGGKTYTRTDLDRYGRTLLKMGPPPAPRPVPTTIPEEQIGKVQATPAPGTPLPPEEEIKKLKYNYGTRDMRIERAIRKKNINPMKRYPGGPFGRREDLRE